MESTDVINEIRGILPRNSIGKYDLPGLRSKNSSR